MAQRTISRKSEIEPILQAALAYQREQDSTALAVWLRVHLLIHKVKFPLLEHLALQLGVQLPVAEQELLVAGLTGLAEHGSSVIIGKLLQGWPAPLLPRALALGTEAIRQGAAWYHSDHLGERLYGHALLTQTAAMLPALAQLLQDKDVWVQRAAGVAAHYATKKGLPEADVARVLDLLLPQAGSQAYEVQRGLGWGLKTIGKFHPALLQARLATIPAGAIAAPIRRKIATGLAAGQSRAGS